MQLSPLNFLNAIALLRNGPEKPCEIGDEEESRVEEFTAYRCIKCGEIYEWEDEAEDCCRTIIAVNIQPAINAFCPICGEHYMEFRDAADCCLWKDLDALTRWRIADAVEAGSDWNTELGIGLH
jgi:hypothetical protein